jgi:two-component system, LytTR family, response regulator
LTSPPARPGKIQALIVDDEALARSNVRVLLSRDSQIQVLGECDCGVAAITEIRRLRPQLVFLDVQMPECDGFEVLEQLGGGAPPAIIFVTAYDEYALRAFAAGALDYLLKPFDDARFYLALERAKRTLTSIVSPAAQRLVIKEGNQVVFVKTADIDWIEAADYYACVHVGSKVHLLRRSLSDLEKELDSRGFSRIHRTAIVNLERIHRLALSDNGDYQVVLETGKVLRLSRRFRRQLQTRLGVRPEE